MKTKLKFEDIKVGDKLVDGEGLKNIVLAKTDYFIITMRFYTQVSKEEAIWTKGFFNCLKASLYLTDYYRPEPVIGAFGLINTSDGQEGTRINLYDKNFKDMESYQSFCDRLRILTELAMCEGAREFDVNGINFMIGYNAIAKSYFSSETEVYAQIFGVCFDTRELCQAAIDNLGKEKLKILFGVGDE